MSNYAARVYEFTGWENTPLTILARMRGNGGAYITQASLNGITCKSIDTVTGSTVASPTVTVASSVFDTLQTSSNDPRWTGDATGFNFVFTIPAAAFPTGNRKYRVEFTFDPVSGEDFRLVVEVFARNLMG